MSTNGEGGNASPCASKGLKPFADQSVLGDDAKGIRSRSPHCDGRMGTESAAFKLSVRWAARCTNGLKVGARWEASADVWGDVIGSSEGRLAKLESFENAVGEVVSVGEVL